METQEINTAVVVLNWNGINWLKKFLPILIEKSKGANIYIADNASTDNSVDYVNNNFPSVKVLKNFSNATRKTIVLKYSSTDFFQKQHWHV